jgi:hypothetical protein
VRAKHRGRNVDIASGCDIHHQAIIFRFAALFFLEHFSDFSYCAGMIAQACFDRAPASGG